MVKIFKIMNKINPPMMNFMFERKNKMYNLKVFQRVCEEKKSNRKNGF